MKKCSQFLFPFEIKKAIKKQHYKSILTISENQKGVLDIDTVKGCTVGMEKYPVGGCYDECYAFKLSRRTGVDFRKSISRKILDREHLATLLKLLKTFPISWYRIGNMGDPSHDWDNTITVINALRHAHKIPVIVSKHWVSLQSDQIKKLKQLNAVFNVSTSGLDSDDEIKYRVEQLARLRYEGLQSICRVVTCKFGRSQWAQNCNDKQNYLLSLVPAIDNPLRTKLSNKYVLRGDIEIMKKKDSIGGGGKNVSLNSKKTFIGKCDDCPDQCGIDGLSEPNLDDINESKKNNQIELFSNQLEFLYVESVIGSGFEKDVAKLALEDGIAHRAARKNMQIHSAIILLINKKFAGFFTFQNNHDVKEFCMLQSVIAPEHYTDDLYKQMVLGVIKQNTEKYPALMTTNPKSKFETPKLFKSLGFQTYLSLSGFEYMVYGELSDIRLKLLAHITMVNTWETSKGQWLKIKKEWNNLITEAGEKNNIQNPSFATREGCWQGEAGFANVVTGHSSNGNASVLDPTACEAILRFFMPSAGKRVYNPFGGGVQFGFVCGSYGYGYVASEIRQNQCDANNKICSNFKNVKWIKSDSSKYKPRGKFDLVFSCPPYYRVERYLDYDGKPPPGEINHLSSYEEFRDALFAGYKIAMDHLNGNCFLVIMTGDSRDKKGAYHCSEAETELFLRDSGLIIYNKITYLERKFTRMAQAKKTLNTRKFPKCEQKIIVAFKGDPSKIKDLYQNVGRL
jgi:hypothetical protein